MKNDFVELRPDAYCYYMNWWTHLGFGSFETIGKQRLSIWEKYISVCNFKDKYIFVSGGRVEYETVSNKVHVYELKTEKWFRGPDMNIRRIYHSSCALGNSIYVICGTNNEGESINTIESL